MGPFKNFSYLLIEDEAIIWKNAEIFFTDKYKKVNPGRIWENCAEYLPLGYP